MHQSKNYYKLKVVYYLVLIGVSAFLVHHGAIIHVQGTSMYPTLKDDTYTICRKASTYDRGDIVILRQEPTGSIIKRIIGVAGDHVVMTPTETTVNDEAVYSYLENTSSDHTVDTIVPDNCIFVVGDNRADSWDSRYFGAVSLDKVDYKLITSNTVDGNQYILIMLFVSYVVCMFVFDDIANFVKKILIGGKENG